MAKCEHRPWQTHATLHSIVKALGMELWPESEAAAESDDSAIASPPPSFKNINFSFLGSFPY